MVLAPDLLRHRENEDWFAATIGGHWTDRAHLLGYSCGCGPLSARMIDYEGIQFHGIDEFLELTRKGTEKVEYTVSWIDCASRRGRILRAAFLWQGDHSRSTQRVEASRLNPSWCFRSTCAWVPALNQHDGFHFQHGSSFISRSKPRVQALQDYEPFFYPLDKVLHWNRMLRQKSGLLQFQYAIPWESARKKVRSRSCMKIANSGLASFLAVLKAFGDVPISPGHNELSRLPGITLRA